MSDPRTLPLHHRLELSVNAWLRRAIDAGVDPDGYLERARQRLVSLMEVLVREEDSDITPEHERPKLPRLILAASDEGRTVAYAPIRNLRLRVVIRANALTPAGAADPFLADCGAVESLLDDLNLQTAWSSTDFAIAVMLAVHKPANSRATKPGSSIRTEVYHVDVRAVGLEHTA